MAKKDNSAQRGFAFIATKEEIANDPLLNYQAKLLKFDQKAAAGKLKAENINNLTQATIAAYAASVISFDKDVAEINKKLETLNSDDGRTAFAHLSQDDYNESRKQSDFSYKNLRFVIYDEDLGFNEQKQLTLGETKLKQVEERIFSLTDPKNINAQTICPIAPAIRELFDYGDITDDQVVAMVDLYRTAPISDPYWDQRRHKDIKTYIENDKKLAQMFQKKQVLSDLMFKGNSTTTAKNGMPLNYDYNEDLDVLTATPEKLAEEMIEISQLFQNNKAMDAYSRLHTMEATLYPDPVVTETKQKLLQDNIEMVKLIKRTVNPGYAATEERALHTLHKRNKTTSLER